jgi:hypothetical protein
MRYSAILLILLSYESLAEDKYEFTCEPIEGETSFRVNGYFFENKQGDNIGIAHSYAVFGEYEPLEGCRVPWYEKFALSGTTSVKFMLHWCEYMPGCVQRFQIPTVSAPGMMWVAKKEDSLVKSKVIRANCKVSKRAK